MIIRCQPVNPFLRKPPFRWWNPLSYLLRMAKANGVNVYHYLAYLLKKLPIGIDIFEKLDREEFYYVDKTGMIEDLL